MAKFQKRLLAIELRRKGLSIGDIARKLDVSKSSISSWCADIELTKRQTDLIAKNAFDAGHKGRMAGAQANKKKKLDAIQNSKTFAKKFLKKISRRDLLIAGIALYWAEGSKSDSVSGFHFTNSDPKMILVMCKWLKEIMSVRKEDLVPKIMINVLHEKRINIVLKFWSDLLDLPQTQFGNTFFIRVKHKKVYENHDSYYGVLVLKVRRSTKLRYKTLSLIEILKTSG